MKIKDLVSEIAKEEGLKSQVSIGNIREIVTIISKKFARATPVEFNELAAMFYANGRRALKRKKK